MNAFHFSPMPTIAKSYFAFFARMHVHYNRYQLNYSKYTECTMRCKLTNSCVISCLVNFAPSLCPSSKCLQTHQRLLARTQRLLSVPETSLQTNCSREDNLYVIQNNNFMMIIYTVFCLNKTHYIRNLIYDDFF